MSKGQDKPKLTQNELPKIFDDDDDDQNVSFFGHEGTLSQFQEENKPSRVQYVPKAANLVKDAKITNPYQQYMPQQVQAGDDDITGLIGEIPQQSKLFSSKSRDQTNSLKQKLVDLVGTSGNRRIGFSPQLITKTGAEAWVANNHPNEGWYVNQDDLDNDNINDITIYDSKGNIYALNGHTLKPSNLASLNPFYSQFPTKELRKQARAEGWTPNKFAVRYVAGEEKDFDINNPYEVKYKDDYENSALYRNLKAQHRLPHIPKTRSPYQLFTQFIVKPVFDAYKSFMLKDKRFKQFVEKSTDGKIKIKDTTKYQLPTPSILWFAAWAYAEYIKIPIIESLLSTPGIVKELKKTLRDKLRLMEEKVQGHYYVNFNKLAKLRSLIKNIDDIKTYDDLNTLKEYITSSSGYKEQSKNIVKKLLNDENRPKAINNLFKVVIEALQSNKKLWTEEQEAKVSGKTADVSDYKEDKQLMTDYRGYQLTNKQFRNDWYKQHSPRFGHNEEDEDITEDEAMEIEESNINHD